MKARDRLLAWLKAREVTGHPRFDGQVVPLELSALLDAVIAEARVVWIVTWIGGERGPIFSLEDARKEAERHRNSGHFKGVRIVRCSPCEGKPDINICGNCGGPADQGFDRCYPPNPYDCHTCHAEDLLETAVNAIGQMGDDDEDHWAFSYLKSALEHLQYRYKPSDEHATPPAPEEEP